MSWKRAINLLFDPKLLISKYKKSREMRSWGSEKMKLLLRQFVYIFLKGCVAIMFNRYKKIIECKYKYGDNDEREKFQRWKFEWTLMRVFIQILMLWLYGILKMWKIYAFLILWLFYKMPILSALKWVWKPNVLIFISSDDKCIQKSHF